MHMFGLPAVPAFGGPRGPFRRSYRCFGPSFMPHPNDKLEEGDKIVLHSSALAELHELMTKGPLVFEVKNAALDTVAHVGVLEFSGEDADAAYLPSWVMDNLALEDGQTANFRVKTLPKVTFVKFQPLDYSFAEAVSEPRAALEHVLRQYTALTKGNDLVMRYARRSYTFKVVELRPADAVSLVNAECEVDFAEPAGGKPTTFSVLKDGEPAEGSVGEGDSNYYTLVLQAADTGVTVELVCADGGDADLYISCTESKPSRSQHTWSSTATSATKSVSIVPTDPQYPDIGAAPGSSAGAGGSGATSATRAVFYVAVNGYKAATSRPTSALGSGSTTSAGGGRTLRADDADSKTSAAVPDAAAVGADVRFTLTARRIPAAAETVAPEPAKTGSSGGRTVGGGRTLGGGSGAGRSRLLGDGGGRGRGGASEGKIAGPSAAAGGSLGATATTPAGNDASAPAPDTEKCANCQQYVPARTIAMHEAFCRRNNFRCDKCGQVMRISEKEKHMDVKHAPVACDCGVMVEPDFLTTHQQHECLLRKEPCNYCGIDVAMRDIEAHAEYCGARTVPCDLCKKAIVVKNLNNHMAAAHGVNPSLPDGVSAEEARHAAIATFKAGGSIDSGAAPAGVAAPPRSSVFSSAPMPSSPGRPMADTHPRFRTAGTTRPPAASTAASRASASAAAFVCEFCAEAFTAFDDLQVHTLTSCPHAMAAEVAAADAVAAPPPKDAADESEAGGGDEDDDGKVEVGNRFAVLADDDDDDDDDGEGVGGVDGGGAGAAAAAGDGKAVDTSAAGSDMQLEGSSTAMTPSASAEDDEYEYSDDDYGEGDAIDFEDVMARAAAESTTDAELRGAAGASGDAAAASAREAAPTASPAAGTSVVGGGDAFKCPDCSFRADAFDDVQVHQLTECPKLFGDSGSGSAGGVSASASATASATPSATPSAGVSTAAAASGSASGSSGTTRSSSDYRPGYM